MQTRQRPLVRRGRPGRLEHGQDVLDFTVPPNGVAKPHFGAHFRRQPDGRNGERLRPPDPGRNPGDSNTAEVEEDTATSLLLKHEFLDGGADDVTLATLGKVLLEPTLTTLGNFLARSNSQLGQLHGGRLLAGGLRRNERLRLERVP